MPNLTISYTECVSRYILCPTPYQYTVQAVFNVPPFWVLCHLISKLSDFKSIMFKLPPFRIPFSSVFKCIAPRGNANLGILYTHFAILHIFTSQIWLLFFMNGFIVKFLINSSCDSIKGHIVWFLFLQKIVCIIQNLENTFFK